MSNEITTDTTAVVETETDSSTEQVVEDNTETVETPEPTAEDTELKDWEDLGLDDLLGEAFNDHEELGQAHKGLPHASEIIKHLPENARKLLGNMRAGTTRKMQEVATLKAELEAERAALRAEREALFNGDMSKNLTEILSKPETELADAWTEEGIQQRIERATAEKLQAMLKPQQEQLARQQKEAAMNSFLEANPLAKTPEYRTEIYKLLVADQNLSLENAYHIVHGKKMTADAVEKRAQELAEKKARKDSFKRTGSGSSNRGNSTPKFNSAWEAYQWEKSRQGNK